jgi:hypothetical protein
MAALDILTKQDLQDFKTELFQEIQKLITGKSDPKNSKWLRSRDVRQMLGISPGTLQSLRVNGTLPFSMIGKIPYYKLDDILRILQYTSSKVRRGDVS